MPRTVKHSNFTAAFSRGLATQSFSCTSHRLLPRGGHAPACRGRAHHHRRPTVRRRGQISSLTTRSAPASASRQQLLNSFGRTAGEPSSEDDRARASRRGSCKSVDGLRSSPLGARVLVLDGAALLLRGRRWSRAKPASAPSANGAGTGTVIGTVKLAESRLGKSRVGRVKGRDEDASRPDLRRPSLPR